jgi:hypothetical protein
MLYKKLKGSIMQINFIRWERNWKTQNHMKKMLRKIEWWLFYLACPLLFGQLKSAQVQDAHHVNHMEFLYYVVWMIIQKWIYYSNKKLSIVVCYS